MVAKLLSTAAAALVLTALSASAQTGRIPAEIPPADYTLGQYVDSAGCVFIRAGSNGRTTWVPRFGDDRRPMCGFAPSLSAGAAQVATTAPTMTAPAAAPAPAPVTVAAAPTTPRRTAPVEVAATTRPYSVAPEASRPVVRVQAAPQAQVWQAQSNALDTRWSFFEQQGPSVCNNYGALSQLYAVPSPALPDLPVRCQPQAQHPADALRELSPRGGVWEPWNGSPMPAQNNNVYILPPPYAPSWPQPWLHGASGQQPAAPAPAMRSSVSTMGSTAAVDSRPASDTRGQMSNGQYVQIGTFGVQSNAQAAISRLQSQGMPVARGNATMNGQPVQVVLAGPFASPAELSAALNAARAMGYGDAFVR